MRSFRFLLTRRWIIFAVVVVALTYLAYVLGQWQFHRLDDRRAENSLVVSNEEEPPAPVAEVLAPGRAPAEEDEWRRVTATGTYAVDDTVIVRYRTRDGAAGVDVVVPLVTAGGTALLVDRGWVATGNTGAGVTAADVPAPPSGEVTVEGWVRRDATGDSATVSDQSTRAIASTEIGPALGREVYGGFVDLVSEDPAPAEAPAKPETPDLGEGPHFFYGLQWWFFGLLAVVGFGWLARDEYLGRTRGPRRRTRGSGPRPPRPARRRPVPQSARRSPPSTGSATPVRYDAAGESTKVATRPNSSGSP